MVTLLHYIGFRFQSLCIGTRPPGVCEYISLSFTSWTNSIYIFLTNPTPLRRSALRCLKPTWVRSVLLLGVPELVG